MTLPPAETNVEAAQKQRHANGFRTMRPSSPDHSDPERDGIDRIDDPYPIPCHAQIREWPEQLRPVARERVEGAVRRVADDRGEDHFAFVILEPLHKQKGQRGDQASHGYENQAVREVAME